MRDVKARSAFEADEIFFREFVQMNHDPSIIDDLAFEHHRQRRFSRAAIVHWATETLQQFKQPTPAMTEHLHLLVRLSEVCREQHFVPTRGLRREAG